MNVVFCNRSDWESSPGGDTIQMLRTKEALENCGINVTLASRLSDLKDADLVHIFNTQRAEELLPWARMAKNNQIPLALSTIHWDLSHYIYVSNLYKIGLDSSVHNVYKYKSIFDFVSNISGHLIKKPDYYSDSHRRAVRLLVECADVLLPNSEEEASLFFRNYSIEKKHYRVAMNAIDSGLFNFSAQDRDLDIISVGRLEPTKNQLSLLRSITGTSWKVKLIGRYGENSKYNALLSKIARGNQVDIVGNLSQIEVAKYMQRSKVHVLPSFRESPGLVTLEALAMGCNVVVADSRFCPVETYFRELVGSRVFVCDPYSTKSIRASIAKALEASETSQILEYVAPQWIDVGISTLKAYREVM